MLNLYPNVNSGVVSKLGIGIEATAGAAVKAGRLISLVSFDPGTPGMKRIKRNIIKGVPATAGYVNGDADFLLKVTSEATPECFDELFSLFFGAPTTSASAAPAAPAAPTVTNVGAAGVVIYNYKVVARSPQGDSALSAAGTTTTGNAALSPTNYNQITFTGIQGATSYLIINSGTNVIVGQTQNTTFNDQGANLGAYAAPAAPAGNQQLWSANNSFLHGTLIGYYGTNYTLGAANGNPLLHVWGGCHGDKLALKWDKKAGNVFQIDADLRALGWACGFTALANVGLDVAGYDTLDPYAQASAVVKFASIMADCKMFNVDIDRTLTNKDGFTGYHAPVAHLLGGANHKYGATLSFSTDAELQRFFGQVNQAGTYSQINKVITFPVELVMAAINNNGLGITNSGGSIINQFGVYSAVATYETVGQPIQGKQEITQAVQICPLYDNGSTATDVQISNVNSRSNASIITAGTAITGFNYGSLSPYSN